MCIIVAASAIAQKNTTDSGNCEILKNINFNKGIDTLEFEVLYLDFSPANQEHPLELLANKHELQLDEYLDKNYNGTTVAFSPLNCQREYQATLSRKIYDHTYVVKSKNIGDYNREYVNLNNLKTSQKLHVKCIVYEDTVTRNKHGGYFFTIIELKPM